MVPNAALRVRVGNLLGRDTDVAKLLKEDR